MSTQNTSASIDLNRQLLYYTIRLQNSDDSLHAWMRHILAYLTTTSEELQPARNELQHQQQRQQEPHLVQSEGCDGSCDCATNMWVRELSYEQHCRKLLMSRVNVGDTHLSGSVDEDSLRREASMVMESVNQATNDQSAADDDDDDDDTVGDETPMDIDDTCSLGSSSSAANHSSSSEWDFVMYDSDVESEVDSLDDPTYKPCGSDLLKMDSEYDDDDDDEDDDDEEEEEEDEYSDEDDEFDVDSALTDDEQEVDEEMVDEEDEEGVVDNLSNFTYNVRIKTSLHLNAAGNTERRTVKILRHYNSTSGGGGGASASNVNVINNNNSSSSKYQNRRLRGCVVVGGAGGNGNGGGAGGCVGVSGGGVGGVGGSRRRRLVGARSVVSADDGCESFYDGSDDGGDGGDDEDEFYENGWERPSSNN